MMTVVLSIIAAGVVTSQWFLFFGMFTHHKIDLRTSCDESPAADIDTESEKKSQKYLFAKLRRHTLKQNDQVILLAT